SLGLYDFQWNVLAFSTSLRNFFLSCAVFKETIVYAAVGYLLYCHEKVPDYKPFLLNRQRCENTKLANAGMVISQTNKWLYHDKLLNGSMAISLESTIAPA
ncbi:hypothetical protein L9F63_006988, partial [Diploptera punctata]